jgi:hypothetical protein
MKINFYQAKRHKSRCAFASSAIFAIIYGFFGASNASAQEPVANTNAASHESERAAQVRALNNSVLQLHGQIQENVSRADAVRGQAAIVLTQRATALQALIKEDPHVALSFAFSPELLADLAAKFPDSSAVLESHAAVSGRLEHWMEDSADLKSSHSYFRMKFGQQVLNLHFAMPESDLNEGDVLEVSGVLAGTEMAVSKTRIAVVGSILTPALIMNSGDTTRVTTILLLLLGLAFLTISSRMLIGDTYGRRACGLVFVHLKGLATCLAALTLVAFSPSSSDAQGACATTGVQQTAVLLINVPGGALPSGITVPLMQDVFFATNTSGPSVDGFLRDASFGQTSAAGGVFGPYNLAGSYTSCQDVSNGILNDSVAAAAAAGVNLNNYSRLFIVFNDTLGCGWAGYTQIGSAGCSVTTTSGTFAMTVVYIDANYASPRPNAVSLMSHELGHDFGLLHSGTIAPVTASDVLGPLAAPGTETDMGDYWSVMGEEVLWLFAGPQKANVLNWFTSATNVQTVNQSGTYTLQPQEATTAGLQLLKVQRGSANSGYYLWVEFHQPASNYNSPIADPAYSGALIHYQDPTTSSAHTYLPNFSPGVISGNNAPLAVGQSWADPYTNLSLTVVSATSGGLTINVNYGAEPCTASAPSLSVSPLNPSIYPGQSASYSALVTNNDSSGCSANTINLGSSEPTGWTTSLSAISVTLNPGQSMAVAFGKGAPNGTPTGTYAVNLTAASSNAGTTRTANATVMASPSLAVNVSTNGTTFVPPSVVSLSASVSNGGVPASGASVTFTLALPNGTTATQSATTNTSGTATWNYKLTSRSQVGLYSVTAQAGQSSGKGKNAGSSQTSAASRSATFIVQ